MSLRAAVGDAEDFVWCPTGCGSGQLHETGREQPIVTCNNCDHRFCFVHGVAWHENFSCSEYDELQQDPENFRSRFEGGNERVGSRQRSEDRQRQEQEESDRRFAQVSYVLAAILIEDPY